MTFFERSELFRKYPKTPVFDHSNYRLFERIHAVPGTSNNRGLTVYHLLIQIKYKLKQVILLIIYSFLQLSAHVIFIEDWPVCYDTLLSFTLRVILIGRHYTQNSVTKNAKFFGFLTIIICDDAKWYKIELINQANHMSSVTCLSNVAQSHYDFVTHLVNKWHCNNMLKILKADRSVFEECYLNPFWKIMFCFSY